MIQTNVITMKIIVKTTTTTTSTKSTKVTKAVVAAAVLIVAAAVAVIAVIVIVTLIVAFTQIPIDRCTHTQMTTTTQQLHKLMITRLSYLIETTPLR